MDNEELEIFWDNRNQNSIVDLKEYITLLEQENYNLKSELENTRQSSGMIH